MTHLYSLEEANLPEHSIVTIGVFDGVHKGHQYLIKRLVDEAHATGRLAVVLTFFPHPDVVLRDLQGRYYLTTAEQKAELLTELGVDCVVTHPFNDAVRQVRAAAFVDQLLQNLKMSALWVGSDFAMGYKREGNVPFLREQGLQKGFLDYLWNAVRLAQAAPARLSRGHRRVLQRGEGQERARPLA